jgi:hypothetical protein
MLEVNKAVKEEINDIVNKNIKSDLYGDESDSAFLLNEQREEVISPTPVTSISEVQNLPEKENPKLENINNRRDIIINILAIYKDERFRDVINTINGFDPNYVTPEMVAYMLDNCIENEMQYFSSNELSQVDNHISLVNETLNQELGAINVPKKVEAADYRLVTNLVENDRGISSNGFTLEDSMELLLLTDKIENMSSEEAKRIIDENAKMLSEVAQNNHLKVENADLKLAA